MVQFPGMITQIINKIGQILKGSAQSAQAAIEVIEQIKEIAPE